MFYWKRMSLNIHLKSIISICICGIRSYHYLYYLLADYCSHHYCCYHNVSADVPSDQNVRITTIMMRTT